MSPIIPMKSHMTCTRLSSLNPNSADMLPRSYSFSVCVYLHLNQYFNYVQLKL